MPQIDPVILRLEVDLRNYQSGLSQAERLSDQSFSAIASKAMQTGQNIRQGFDLAKSAAGGVQVIVDVVRKNLEYASSIGDIAQKLGVTTKALQEFRFAGSQVGLSVKESDDALEHLSDRLREAGKGSEEQAKTFETLGIKIKDAKGEVIDAGEAFPLIAGALQKIDDPAKRSALSVELFGEKGRKLALLLAGGTKSIDGLRDAAHRLGVVLSEDQIKNADQAAAKLESVKQVLEAKIAGIVADNAGSIIQLADSFGRLATQALDLFRALNRLANHPGMKAVTELASHFNPATLGLKGLDHVSRVYDQANKVPESAPAGGRAVAKRPTPWHVGWQTPMLPKLLVEPAPHPIQWGAIWPGAAPVERHFKQNFASTTFGLGPSPLEGWTPGGLHGLAAISASMSSDPAEPAKKVRETTAELAKLRGELDLTEGRFGQAFERIGVEGLRKLESGLLDAIRGVKDLGDVFKDVANQIIADLLRIAIRQAIIKPLANLMFGPGISAATVARLTPDAMANIAANPSIFASGGYVSGPGSGTSDSIVARLSNGEFVMSAAAVRRIGVDSLDRLNSFGRASGGYVAPDQFYRVNEAASPGRVEGFIPQGAGEIIPLGRMNALASPARSGPAVINVTVNAKDAVLTHTVQQWVRDGVAAAAQLGTVAGAAEGERRVMSRGRRRIPG